MIYTSLKISFFVKKSEWNNYFIKYKPLVQVFKKIIYLSVEINRPELTNWFTSGFFGTTEVTCFLENMRTHPCASLKFQSETTVRLKNIVLID